MKGTATITAMAMLAATETAAFAPSQASKASSTTSLNLVPDQGSQLVAFYANSVEEEKLHPNIKVDKISHNRGAIAAAKESLSKIFHMPSIKHPGQKKEDDVVYYPMVGFRFFEGVDTVFPTTSHVPCTLATKAQQEEEVYGWFSSSCKLDVFSEDVCQNPVGSEDDADSVQ